MFDRFVFRLSLFWFHTALQNRTGSHTHTARTRGRGSDKVKVMDLVVVRLALANAVLELLDRAPLSVLIDQRPKLHSFAV